MMKIFFDYMFLVLWYTFVITAVGGLIGTIYALYKMCKERDESVWEIFGKSATEGEYGTRKKDTPVPAIRWTDRSFRDERETSGVRQEGNEETA